MPKRRWLIPFSCLRLSCLASSCCFRRAPVTHRSCVMSASLVWMLWIPQDVLIVLNSYAQAPAFLLLMFPAHSKHFWSKKHWFMFMFLYFWKPHVGAIHDYSGAFDSPFSCHEYLHQSTYHTIKKSHILIS